MLIKVGDTIRTDFCTGDVQEIIDGIKKRWTSDIYYRIKVTDPKVHWRRRNQIVKIEEVKQHHAN